MIDFDELSIALSDDKLVPYFQPIVELRTGAISGFEVLTRWAHPTLGAYLPINLIELAEQRGLISEVSRQVFTKAFCQFGDMPKSLRLSVNVSPVQLGHAEFPRQMQAISEMSGFPLSRLTMEITESALLSDFSRSLDVANALKELGCRLSLDDFGTGFSSLAHLQALPFDELKIDRSFVARMTQRRDSRKIVAAIVGLARSLRLTTVAEGVETADQADVLLRLGSELGQGWHYGRPMPLDSLRGLVEERSSRAVPDPAYLPGPHATVSSLEAFPAQRLAQLQAIYDGAPVGLCFLDCNLRYVNINQRLARMNGASVAAHLGNTVEEMLPDVFPHLSPLLKRALAGEPISGVEVPKRNRDTGQPGWILVSYQPAYDEACEVIGLSVSVLEITELKQAREELRSRAVAHRQRAEVTRQPARPKRLQADAPFDPVPQR